MTYVCYSEIRKYQKKQAKNWKSIRNGRILGVGRNGTATAAVLVSLSAQFYYRMLPMISFFYLNAFAHLLLLQQDGISVIIEES